MTQVASIGIDEHPRKRQKLTSISNESFIDISQHSDFTGGMATSPGSNVGALHSIRLINFMCHDNLYIEFGPSINFIVGQNGSGKSAILTALMICLGTHSTKTQRGHKLSSFIKENENYATIRLILNNFDPYSYKVVDFGDQIIIERRLNRDSASAYCIKSASGRKISSKKEDIDLICEHFRIQLENPITILTQDVAKNYLSSSSDHAKYEFFEKGSYLHRLRLDFGELSEKKYTMMNLLKRAENTLPKLKEEVKQLESKLNDLTAIKQLHCNQDMLRRELVWSHVYEAESKFQDLENQLLAKEKAIDHLENTNLSGKSIGIDAKLVENNDRMVNLNAVQIELRNKKTELEEILVQHRRDVNNFQTTIRSQEFDENELGSTATKHQASINNIQVMIQKEKDSYANQSEILGQLQKQLASSKQTLERLEAQQKKIIGDRNKLIDHISSLESNQVELEKSYDSFNRASNSLLPHIQMLESSKKNRLDIYGRNISKLLNYLASPEGSRLGFQQQPIGPIGLHVKLKDPKWSLAVEAIIGRFLNSFIVASYNDRRLLQDLLSRFQCDNQVIMKRTIDKDAFREPPDSFLTAFRVCEYSSSDVSDVLRLLSNFDRILLCVDRHEANRNLENTNYGGSRLPNADSAFTKDAVRITSGPNAKTHFSFGRSGQKHSRYFDDLDLQIAPLRKDLESRKATLTEKGLEIENMKIHKEQLAQALQEFTNKQTQIAVDIQMLQKTVKSNEIQLQSAIVDNESENHLDQEHRDINRKFVICCQQIKDIQKQKRESQMKKEALLEAISQTESTLERLEKELANRTEEMDALLLQQDELQRQNQTWLTKKNKLHMERDKISLLLNNEMVAYENIKAKALKACPEPEHRSSRSPYDIEKDLEITLRRLSSQKNVADLAFQLQTISSTLTSCRNSLDRALNEYDAVSTLVARLDRSLKIRFSCIRDFRNLATLEIMMSFNHYMRSRGFDAELLIDHDAKTLKLRVQVYNSLDHMDGKDVKSLSGGEKSLATTCLMISLWHTMETPLRALDEFDVFMDPLNRSIILSMLLEFSNDQKIYSSLPNTQYLFITPQNISKSLPSDLDVRVISMHDPKRDKS